MHLVSFDYRQIYMNRRKKNKHTERETKSIFEYFDCKFHNIIIFKRLIFNSFVETVAVNVFIGHLFLEMLINQLRLLIAIVTDTATMSLRKKKSCMELRWHWFIDKTAFHLK